MRLLSQIQDEDALDVLADIIKPAVEIIGDEDVKKAFENGGPIALTEIAIRKHKKSVLAILAAAEEVPVEEYHCNVLTLPLMCMKILSDPYVQELLNDPETLAFFTSAGAKTE